MEEIGKSFDIHHLVDYGVITCQNLDPEQRPTMQEVLEQVKDMAKNVVSGRDNIV